MSEKIKTAIMEVIKAHMDGEDKNTKAVLSDVMESVREILEQEPCDECRNKRTSFCGNCNEYDEFEPCDDAVSRKSILKYIDDWWSDSRDDIEDLIIYITYLPSVTQRSETITEFADRCRECGAKMVEPQESEDKE